MTSIDSNLPASRSVKSTDEKIRVFQRKLYIRAKRDEGFKAYSLYGKFCETTTLKEAYRRVKSNYSKGVGVDKQSFEDIEKKGVKTFLASIQKDLVNYTYRSKAVRQVLIPKEKKGDYRKLGIPTIRDRVVQINKSETRNGYIHTGK